MIVYSLWTLAAVEWAECLGGTCHDGFDSLQRGDSFHTALCAVYTLLKASQGSSPWGLDSLWLVYLSTYSQLSSLWYLCSHFTAHIVIGTWDDSSYWFCYGFVGFFGFGVVFFATDSNYWFCHWLGFYQSWISFIHVSMTKTAWMHTHLCALNLV